MTYSTDRAKPERPAFDGMRAASEGLAPAVLLVDDEPDCHALVEAILRAWEGSELISAFDAQEGLTLAVNRLPDLILLDLLLPDCTGAEVLEQLRGNELTRSIPVIVVSILDPEDAPEVASRAADAYVTKPLEPQGFLEVLRGALDGRGRSTDRR